LTITIGGIEHIVKLAGTVKNPFFCGKDVCDILQVVSVQLMDFDEMGEMEKVDFVRSVFEEFSVLNTSEEPMRRRDFEAYLADHHNVKFAKMGLWSITKKVANEFKKNIKF
jgi:hypothetical protein